MDRVAIELKALDTREVDDIPFNFANGIRPHETIVDAKFTFEVEAGVADPTAQDAVVGSWEIGGLSPSGEFFPSPLGRVVIQRFSAENRVDKNTYCVRCEVELSSYRRLVSSAHVRVRKL